MTLIGIGALVILVVALAVVLRRVSNVPEEEALEKRISDLERDIQALQRMLTQKQNEIDRLTERIRQLENGVVLPVEPTARQRRRRPVLVLGIGTDRMLEADLVALRGVHELQLAVLRDVSRRSMEALLERHRANGFPVRYLHLAVHACDDGLAFADGLADGLWLSRHLSGVEVLVIAGCQSAEVGDLLSVVPYTITMRDEIDNRDASIFSRAFWTEIGHGASVDAALAEALRRSPSVVTEMVEAHW